MSEKRSFWEKYAVKKLSAEKKMQANEELFILRPEEIKRLKQIRNRTYFLSGLAGVMGIVLLYVPEYLWGEVLFPTRSIWIPIYDNYVDLQIEFLAYSGLLVVLEIWYLTYLNIRAVGQIAVACGSPARRERHYDQQLNNLVIVSTGKKEEDLKKFGINPYDGLSKWAVMLFQTLVRLRAAMSNFIWKLLISRILGRYAFRLVVNLFSAPVYAFWNIWGARKIMNEARVRIMAPPMVKLFVDQLYDEFGDREDFKNIIYDTIQSIASAKRAFHYNHYVLAVALFNRFDIELDESTKYDPNFEERIRHLSPELQAAFVRIFVFGILINGTFSVNEFRMLKMMEDDVNIPYSIKEVDQWAKDYFEGRGLETFFHREI